ncbi:FliM/FliN family flagellar motor switch protein [Serratia quinivorans]|uniref:FliM/FliN family flagellar motor switch protein n=1 Tax=Serratia quinivorans TaxID=137545 RepID=UPI0039825D95
MIRQHLRQLSQTQIDEVQRIQAWRQQGVEAIPSRPPEQARLLAFQADTGWQGHIDLDSWFANVMPEQAVLASEAFTFAQLEALFVASEQPLDMPLAELDYQQFTSLGSVAAHDAQQEYYGLETAQGRVWITACTGSDNPSCFSAKFPVESLPLPLNFELGSSCCTSTLLNKLGCGDILLVTDIAQRITLCGRLLGYYQRDGNEIMLEENFMPPPFGDEFSDNNESNTTQRENNTPLLPRSRIPVRLTFVLQQSTLALQDLEALCQGHVLYCDPHAEKKVLVSANGAGLARGELIWVDDRMGVEITELYHEAGNGK